MFKSTKRLISVSILSLVFTGAAHAQTAPDPAALDFPTSPTQLGGNGELGEGGKGGEGGEGGGRLDRDYNIVVQGQKGGKGETGGQGGAGGSGTWILQNMSPGDAFSNRGTVNVGGLTGPTGLEGFSGFLSGGRGGANATVFGSAQDGEEPRLPADLGGGDPWPDTQQGGKGGGLLDNGEDGTDGGGGGGAGLPIWLIQPSPGNGGKGIAGSDAIGGSGSPGIPEASLTTAPFTNDASIQIGGDGGQGGQGGMGGSGGGGYGGGWEGGAPGDGGDGGPGGDGGKGTIELRNDGNFINEGGGTIVIGRGGDGAEGTVNVRTGGALTNRGWIEINDNGTLENFFGGTVSNAPTATINNKGHFGNHGDVNNEGSIYSSTVISNSGKIDNRGIFHSSDSINNSGMLDNRGDLQSSGSISNFETIINQGNIVSGIGINNNGSFINNGIVRSTVGGFTNFGAYTGSGVYLGTFLNNGVVAPGNSVGTAMISGDFVNAVTLEIEIAGFGSGMHDFLDVSGAAAFLEGSLISFLSWEDYGFGDIAPQETKSLEFFRAAGGITAFLSAIAFGEGFLPDGFAYNVLNDGNSLFLEVSNNVPPVPLPPAIWLFVSAILGLGLIARRKRGQSVAALASSH